MPAFQFFGLQQPALAALSCAAPGKDGSPSSALTGTVNTYYPGTASASAGTTSISLGTATGSTTGITSGDLLLVIQMQDAAINSTNSSSYGNGSAGSGSTNLNNSGAYEYVVATNSVTTGGGTLNLRSGLINSYTNAAASSSQGQRRFQVIRVPQYLNATLSSGLTASPWNGSTGGILAIDVAGILQGSGATVNVDGLGFRGGGARQLNGGSGGSSTDYINLASNAFHASKGEGIAGTPRFTYTPGSTTVSDNSTEGYPNGSFARGAPGNAGGGGSDADPASNSQNTGGGGGSNSGAGGQGGFSWNTVQNLGGLGGAVFSGSATRLILGGGGGAGTRNNSAGVQSSGGAGGGIVFIRTGQLAGSATLSANGTAGISPDNDSGGGGGAGGSLAITAFGGTGTLTLNATGGNGGNAWATQAPGTTDQLTTGGGNNRHGPGGGGGGGFILLPSSADGFAGNTSTSVSGGANGISTTANSAYGATSGNSGQSTTVSLANIPGVAAGAQCLQDLTLTKSHAGSFSVGNTGTYTMTVRNIGMSPTSGAITVRDTLPTGLTVNNGAAGAVTLGGTNAANWTCTSNATNPQIITCTSSTAIAATSNSVFTIPVSVSLNTVLGTNSITNTASVSGGGEINTANNSASDPTTVVSPDLTISKTHPGNFLRGGTGSYSLTVGNTGAAATSGTITVVDTLPTGLSVASGPVTLTGANAANWTCSASAQTITCSSSIAIATSGSSIFGFTVSVASNASSSITNTATISGGNEATVNTGNNAASDPTTLLSNAQVLLVKRITAINGVNVNPNDNTPLNTFVDDSTNNDNHPNWPSNYLVGATNAGKIKSGDTIEFTIYFLNAGGYDASAVRVCDRLSQNLSFLPGAYGGAKQDIQIRIGPNSVVSLTAAADTNDRAQLYAANASVPGNCNLKAANTNGTVVIDVTGTTGIPNLPVLSGSTAPGTPTNSYGLVRFTARVP